MKFILFFSCFVLLLCRTENVDTHTHTLSHRRERTHIRRTIPRRYVQQEDEQINTHEPESIAQCNKHTRERWILATYRVQSGTVRRRLPIVSRHFLFIFVEHDVVVLAPGQNAKMLLRAKHETLLTSTAVRINYTHRNGYERRATPNNLNFLSWSGFSSLSRPLYAARITQLSDLHEAHDASARWWALRIRAHTHTHRMGLSIEAEEIVAELFVGTHVTFGCHRTPYDVQYTINQLTVNKNFRVTPALARNAI